MTLDIFPYSLLFSRNDMNLFFYDVDPDYVRYLEKAESAKSVHKQTRFQRGNA